VLALVVASALYWNISCQMQAVAACTELSSMRVNDAVGGAVSALDAVTGADEDHINQHATFARREN
jgi:hypothetical protein